MRGLAGLRRAALLAATLSAPEALAQAAASPAAAAGELADLRARVAALEAQQGSRAADEERALAEEAAVVATEQVEPKLQIYGFLDAGVQQFRMADERLSGLFPSTAASFVSGNANLYFDARPVPRWRGLLETRLTLLPHGLDRFGRPGPIERTDTRLYDTTSTSAREIVQLGGVVVERAQIEWTASDLLSLQVGYFLTPWGIWNVDHGTPTLIALVMPSFLVQKAIPTQQTGVLAFGSWNLPPFELGYRAYVSNGRVAGLYDLTNDKAVGGRLFLRRQGALTYTIGGSGFYGTSSDRQKTLEIDRSLQVSIVSRDTYALREWVMGGDLSADWAGLRLRAEVVGRHVRYEEGRHEPIVSVPGALAPNHYELYAYGLLAYRFGRLEPYTFFEYADLGQSTSVLPDRGRALSLGLNVHLTPMTQLKGQIVEGRFSNLAGAYRTTIVITRLVLAF